MRYIYLFFSLFVFFACNSTQDNSEILNSEMVQFAIQQIEKSKLEHNIGCCEVDFVFDTIHLSDQEFSIELDAPRVIVYGGDERGLMYGGLEVSEQLLMYKKVTKGGDTPYIKNRGLKMNIPLDARTPSYDDSGDAAQQNIKEVWSWDFWTDYLDKMAINRYNVLSLWNPHPFPSMLKLEKYPEVGLNDVCQTTYVPNGYENEMGDPQLVATCVTKNLKVIKKISIDDKITFWKKVMQYAKNRGIDIYWVTWNICPNSVANPVEPMYKTYGINMDNEKPGKHGVTHAIDNQITIDYHREAVKQFLLTYPDIKGIGVTAGEHMPKKWEGKNREEWLWETYGLGILDAKKEQPNREVPFIHRVWHSDMDQIMKYWGNYPDPFEVSFKYSKARLYSSSTPQFHIEHVEQMKRYGLKSWWNLRNDDIFVYRWGNPEYVRSFIRNLPIESTKGIMMGSDGYVWGREFISKNKELAGELEMDKHWLRFMSWGRLAYNPNLNTSFFKKHISLKHQEIDIDKLYRLWRKASEIFPIVNTYHWRDWDAQWQIEQCAARPALGGFRDVFDFVDNPTMEGSKMLSPVQYTKKKSLSEGELSPLNVAEVLLSLSQFCIQEVTEIENIKLDEETNALIDDISAMAYLGSYYAHKINSAAYISEYLSSKEKGDKDNSVKEILLAQKAIKSYASISKKNYKSQMTARAYKIDWDLFVDEVEKEVDLVLNLK